MGLVYRFIFIIFSVVISTSNALAIDFIDLSDHYDKDADAKTRGNWFIGLGARYETASNEFTCPETFCTKGAIEPDDGIDLFGGELRLGRELAIGGVFSLILNAEVFYHENSDETGIKPDDTTVDVFVSEGVIRTSYFGFGGSVGLGLFPFKVGKLVFLPVIEFGFGSGSSQKSAKYYYDDTAATNEYYEDEYEQDFTYTKIGIGLNIIASSGIYAYFRAFTTNYEFDSSERYQKYGTSVEFAPGNSFPPNQIGIAASSESVFAMTIGFGYRF